MTPAKPNTGTTRGKTDEITDIQIVAGDTISIYWHFVDGVWIVVFSVIYLVPLL